MVWLRPVAASGRVAYLGSGLAARRQGRAGAYSAKVELEAAKQSKALADAALEKAENGVETQKDAVKTATEERDAAQKAYDTAVEGAAAKSEETAALKADVAKKQQAADDAATAATSAAKAVEEHNTSLAKAEAALAQAMDERDPLMAPAKAYEQAAAAVQAARAALLKAQDALAAYKAKTEGEDPNGQGEKPGAGDQGADGQPGTASDKPANKAPHGKQPAQVSKPDKNNKSGTLANTGAAVAPLVLAGLSLVAVGAALTDRRRKNS